MSIKTGAYSSQFSNLLSIFNCIIDPKIWLTRCEHIERDMRTKVVLPQVVLQENRIAFALRALLAESRKYNLLWEPDVSSASAYDACALVVQCVDLFQRSSPEDARRLAARVSGAFGNPAELRAIQFEWLLAVHLTRSGFAVSFPEQARTGTVDMIAKKDELMIEVECKSMSRDIGRKVHQKDIASFYEILHRKLVGFVTHVEEALLIQITVPDRFPTSLSSQEVIAEQIADSIVTGNELLEQNIEVRHHRFAIADSPLNQKELNHAEFHAFLGQRFGLTDLGYHFVLYSPKERAIVVSVQSRKPDQMLEKMFSTIKQAQKRQLSGSRPGIICVKLEDVSAPQLEDVASSTEPTGIQRYVSNCIDTRRRSSLVSIAFFADGAVGSTSYGAISRAGSSYIFDNPHSPHYAKAATQFLRDSFEQ